MTPLEVMNRFDSEQLMIVAEKIVEEDLDFAKLQAGLVWVAANGKLDRIGKKKSMDSSDISKLKAAGILEVDNGSG